MTNIMKDTIKDKIDNLFVKNNEIKHNKKQRGGIHTSSIIIPDGSWCPREEILNYFKDGDDYNYLPPRVIRRMENGNALHKKWQEMFERTGVAVKNEKQHYNNCYVTGTPDSVIELGNKRYVVEIKTTNEKNFKSMTKLPIGTKRQIEFYMYLTGIPNGIVIYENTNNNNYEIYLVDYDREFVRKYVARQYKVKDGILKYINKGILPEKHKRCTHKDAGRANSCAATKLCFETKKLEEIVDDDFRN